MPPTPIVSRRTALAGLAVLAAGVASACTSRSTTEQPAATPSPSVTRAADKPDVALAAVVLSDEQAMLDRVVATRRRHPSLAPALSEAQAVHRAHVKLLAGAVPSEASSSAPPRRRHRVPARPGPALAALAKAEEQLALDGRRSAVTARSGAFARILASMAAAASQQSVQLTGVLSDRA